MLFIANCTKQNFHFVFRIPEFRTPSRVEIPSGQQRNLAKEFNLNAKQIEAVVKQCERFGFRRVDEISRKVENFSGFLYSAKTVTSDNISCAHEIKEDCQNLISAQEATKGVLAFDKGSRDKSGKRLASEVEVEVIEQEDPRQRKKDKKVHMKMGISEKGGALPKELR